jgi:hypothetical protein
MIDDLTMMMIDLYSKHKTQQHPPSIQIHTRLNRKSVPPFYFGFLNIFALALFVNKTRTRDARSSKSFVEYITISHTYIIKTMMMMMI